MPSLCKESHNIFPRVLMFSDALDVEGRLYGAAVSLGLAAGSEDARSWFSVARGHSLSLSMAEAEFDLRTA